jgi:hypothetical protein
MMVRLKGKKSACRKKTKRPNEPTACWWGIADKATITVV